MRVLTCLTQEHDLWLVGLAALFCVIGSTITVQLLHRISISAREARLAWIFMGGASTGATIWCTHFIAMIAYNPGVQVTYEVDLTGASLLLAIAGSALALSIATYHHRVAPLAGGAFFGLSVAAMHYTGMMAFAVNGVVRWTHSYVVASIVSAVVLGALAFDRARERDQSTPTWPAAALVFSSIIILHFSGMAAMTFVPLAGYNGGAPSAEAMTFLVLAVAGVGLLVLGTGVATYVLDAQARIETRRRLAELLEGSVDGMVVEQRGVILATNAAFLTLAVAEACNVIGQSLDRWIPNAKGLKHSSLSRTALLPDAGGSVPIEVATRIDRRGSSIQTIYSIRDLRGRIAQERRIAHLAHNDSLTGLPNRTSFIEWLARLTSPHSQHAAAALISIDLDRLKEVNDVHGQAAGDQLLARIGQRLKATLHLGEFAARLGGDEFMAVLPGGESDEALDLVERLRDAITQPVIIGGNEVSCGLSIGVAIWPRDAKDISTLINNADLAKQRAKGSLTQDVCFYEEEMDKAVRTRRRLVNDLHSAIDRKELKLFWQVQQSVQTGEVTGFEALLRWIRSDGTSIPPADFIPIAEQSGLILPIGEWVIRTACREAASWPIPHKIAVNLSPVQLGEIDLPALVLQVLIDTGLSPSRLEVEITETAMIADPARTDHVLRQLKAQGVSVAMDDFGTGYSSLSALRSFRFDKIKLDKSFMKDLSSDPQSAAIIRAVLALGRGLSIPVLAEGVETSSQLDFLREEGCDEAQGYLLGRPAPIEEKQLISS